ncbi:MAG: DUF6773 family protein [Blautia sp.]|nr:DUF6773 family protein [Blautia sp.]
MDAKKIGTFLRELRKEKGLTQEQLAEVLNVSGRTISRWETGTNMPDLSVLIQIAEFYEVEVKEILDGERKGEIMDKELKETLSKVADYNTLEKEKVLKIGNTAFGFTFAVCVAMIVVQLLITGNLSLVAGETAILLAGGIFYLGVMIYHGLWEKGSKLKNTPFTDGVISIICAGVFSALLAAVYLKLGASVTKTAQVVAVFFVGISVTGFGVLRIMACLSKNRKNKITEYVEPKEHVNQPVNIFIADGNMQAEMILNTLKENGIMAYTQDLGDAGFASVRYGMGRGMDDRIAIFVAKDKAECALQVINGMGLK